MAKNFNDFKNYALGKVFDTNGNPSNLNFVDWNGDYNLVGQCVSLIKALIKYIGQSPIARGNAIDYWDKRATNGMLSFCDVVSSPRNGDIVISTGGNIKYGHIFIYCDGQQMTQNCCGEPRTALHPLSHAGTIIGILRPRAWTSTTTSAKKYSEKDLIQEDGVATLTVDLVNARRDTPTGSVVRQYKLGDKVRYTHKWIGDNNRYVSWMEGNVRIFMAVAGSSQQGVEPWATFSAPTDNSSPAPSKPSTNGLTEEKGKVTFKVDQVNARKNSPTGEVVKQFMSGQSQNYDYKYVGNGHRYIVYKDGNDLIYVAVTPTEERSTEWADFGEQDTKPTEQPNPVEQPKPEEKNDDVEQPDLEPELYKPTNGWLERNGITMAYKLVDKSNWAVKCPYVIEKAFPVVHNAGTPGDPDAATLTQSMLNAKSDNTSWHFSVDEKTIVQNLPLNRNCFAQGDFSTGWKSKNGISIEICRDMNHDDLFAKAEETSCAIIADLMYQNGWTIDCLKKHQDFDMKDANGQITHKYCPHKTLDLGWDRYVQMVQKKYDELLAFVNPKPVEQPKEEPKKDEEESDDQKTFFKLWNKLLKRVLGEK